MKIDITAQQYKTLINALKVSSFIYGPMSDMVDAKYKKEVNKIEDIESQLLKHAKDFGMADSVEEFDGKLHVKETYYDKILDDLGEYDDWQTFENITNELAKRDFRADHSAAEIKEIAKKNRGYLGVEIYDYEEKYYNEFRKHGYDRLYIKA